MFLYQIAQMPPIISDGKRIISDGESRPLLPPAYEHAEAKKINPDVSPNITRSYEQANSFHSVNTDQVYSDDDSGGPLAVSTPKIHKNSNLHQSGSCHHATNDYR